MGSDYKTSPSSRPAFVNLATKPNHKPAKHTKPANLAAKPQTSQKSVRQLIIQPSCFIMGS
ncbi:hypothetical protein B0189_06055 [Moraxella cuniculi]|nr:hypothetical protein B0189_06055 [Moraxella cuniculi]